MTSSPKISAPDAEMLSFFAELLGKFSERREDIKTWTDLLDLDDCATFRGEP
jgi:hypothetical protein